MSRFLDICQRVLVVAAHPDDEVLGCGGTILRLVAERKNVHIAILGGVTTSRYAREECEEEGEVEILRTEAENASASLGAASLNRLDLKDNRFDAIPLLEVIQYVDKLKREIEPDLVFTHDFADLNVDHRVTHQAVITAFRPSSDSGCFRIMTFETLSSTEFQDQAMASFQPNCYVDIGEHIQGKIAAMKCYESELRPYPHPRSLEGIEYTARRRGLEVCRQFAEAFRIAREVS
jgi:LmbE family N-acetylglucosaminyl deacetylase